MARKKRFELKIVGVIRCKCGELAHPQYRDHKGAPQCENCWAAAYAHDNRDVYKEKLGGPDPMLESISELGLDLRISNQLEREGILVISDLVRKTAEGLLKINGIAGFALKAIRTELKALGLKLQGD